MNYLLRMANNPGRMDDAAMIAVYGNILDNVALVKFLQKNREGKSGFDFGLKASLEDSTIAVRMLEKSDARFQPVGRSIRTITSLTG